MFRKFTAAAIPAIVVALIAISTIDSASQAFARGRGHSGGHHGGHSHMSRSHHVNHSHSFAKNAHKSHGLAHKQHRDHHRRFRNGYFGWDGGLDGDLDDGAAVDAMDVDPVATMLPITLLNPAETGQMVTYTLGSGDYSIESAGQMVHNDGTQVIVFDRGGAFGQASYTLQPGTYRFVKTDQGLDLRTVRPQVTAAPIAAGNVTSAE
jgi:hypothetical protein